VSSLTDRYVTAAVRQVPDKHRQDVEQELRASIADDIDARVDLGEPPADAEYAALKQLGDPALLAVSYADQTTSLIGPQTYPTYIRVLRWLSATALPIVYIVHAVGYGMRGQRVGDVIFGPIGITLTVAMYLFTVVTLLFAIVDRSRRKQAESAEAHGEWSPDHLTI